MDSYFYNNSNIQIKFKYKKETYTISGQTKIKNNNLYINLGYYGDDFPCIKLEYNYIKEVFYLAKLRAKDFGSYSEEDRVICMQPPLPAKGALDILVHFSLKIAEIINPQAFIKINDMATVDDNKPLSWLKFFEKRTTTYAKYGFIRTKNTLNTEDRKSYPAFQMYMKEILPEYLKQTAEEALSKNTLKELDKIYKALNLKFKRYKMETIEFSKTQTLEKIIKNIIQTSYSREILKAIDKDTEINLNKDWYLSWHYYNTIPEKDKVKIIKIMNI